MTDLNAAHSGEFASPVLCQLARAAIREALGGPPVATPNGPPFNERGATFVSLYRGEFLQGCIGSLEPHQTLGADIAQNAVSAALRDPRAVPLDLADVEQLTVEVSLLSPLERVACHDEASAIAALHPQKDGVLLRYGRQQATFLPQVWASIPDPHEFLTELRLKARLPANFWADNLEVYRYHVKKYVDRPRH